MYRGTAQKPFAGQPGQLAVCLEAQPKNKFLDIVKMRVPRACARLYGKRALCPEAQPTRQTCAVSRGTRLAREILFNFFSSPTMKSIALGLFLVADFEFHTPRGVGKSRFCPDGRRRGRNIARARTDLPRGPLLPAIGPL